MRSHASQRRIAPQAGDSISQKAPPGKRAGARRPSMPVADDAPVATAARPEYAHHLGGISVGAPSAGEQSAPLQRKRNRTGLPDGLKAGVERLGRIPLDDVKVHYNSARPAQVGALAYTQGREIHVAPGQERHLPHEAWHLVQQKQGRVRPNGKVAGKPLNDDTGLEQEAEKMGAHALRVGKDDHAGAEPATSSSSPKGDAMGSGGGAIQRVLDVDEDRLPEALRATLPGAVGAFNNYEHRDANTQDALHAQFGMLDGIEQQVHQHLRDHSDTVSDEQRRHLFGLLRQTQEHHVGLTGRNIEHGHDLWLRNADTMEEGERDATQEQWRSIVGADRHTSDGNLKVQGSTPEARTRLLSGVGQLLQGAHGRGLVSELNAHQENPEKNIIVSDRHQGTYEGFGKDADPGSWAEGIAHARRGEDLHSGRADAPNTGTGSYVQVEPHAPELPALDDHESDASGKALFAPDFVTLGHELGHARHNLRGTAGNPSWYDGDPLGGQELNRKLWTNPEEYANITGEENPIRAEHNMPQRQYHATIKSGRSTRNRHGLETRRDHLWDTVPAEHRGVLGPRHFGPVSRDIDQTDLSDDHAAQDLHGRLDNIEGSLPGEIRWENMKSTVGNALRPTPGKVLGLGLAAALAGGLWWLAKGR